MNAITGIGQTGGFEPRIEQTTEYLLLSKLGLKFPTLRDKLFNLFAVDLRSLALTRIAVGVLILIDLGLRLPDLRVFYSDNGLLSRSALREILPPWRCISLHTLSGRSEVEAFLFFISGVFALMLILGLRSRVASVGSWVLLVSLHIRNPFIVHGGDDLLRMLLFWGMFVPWGARCSIESAINENEAAKPRSLLSIGSAAFLVQVALLYFFTGMLKNGREWRHEFTAIIYVLRAPDFARPLGMLMTSFPTVLKVLTVCTLAVEILGALLLFSPIFTKTARYCAVASFFCLQLGLLLTLKLGLFPLVSMTALLPFLPTSLWERIAGSLAGNRVGPLIYYDGNCKFCQKAVRFIRSLCALPRARLVEAQSDPVIHEEMKSLRSWVVVGEGNLHYYGFDALTYLVKRSPILWPISPFMRWPPIRFLGNRTYQFVAQHRGTLAASLTWLRPSPVRVNLPLIPSLVCLFFLSFVVIDNLGSIARSPIRIPSRLSFVGRGLKIHQNWKLFAPTPPRSSRWVVVDGRQQDGQVAMLFDGYPLSAANPDNKPWLIRNYNWRTFWIWANMEDTKKLQPSAARYFCNSWNLTHTGGTTLSAVTLHKLDKPIHLDGTEAEAQDSLLLDYHCTAANQ
jgi:predicted DCC family thiol-disulfide oxidoreductase YuxK